MKHATSIRFHEKQFYWKAVCASHGINSGIYEMTLLNFISLTKNYIFCIFWWCALPKFSCKILLLHYILNTHINRSKSWMITKFEIQFSTVKDITGKNRKKRVCFWFYDASALWVRSQFSIGWGKEAFPFSLKVEILKQRNFVSNKTIY